MFENIVIIAGIDITIRSLLANDVMFMIYHFFLILFKSDIDGETRPAVEAWR